MSATLARLRDALLPAGTVMPPPVCDFSSALPGSFCFYEVVPLPQGEVLYSYRTQGRTAIDWIQRSLGVPTSGAWDQATIESLYAYWASRGTPLSTMLVTPGAVAREIVEAGIATAMARPRDRVLVRPDATLPTWGQVPPDDGAYRGRMWRDNHPVTREAVMAVVAESDMACPVGCRPDIRTKITWQQVTSLATIPNLIAFAGYTMAFWYLLRGPEWAGGLAILCDIVDTFAGRLLGQTSITSTQYDWILSGSVTAMAASRLGLPPLVIAGLPIAQAFLRARNPDLPVGSFRSVLMAAVLTREWSATREPATNAMDPYRIAA